MSEFFRSLSLIARSLLGRPGFVSLVVLVVALGAGALAVVSCVFHAVFVRPLPYAHAERLLTVVSAKPAVGARRLAVSYQDFRDWRDQSAVFEELAAVSSQPRSVVLTGGDRAEHLDVDFISWNFLPMLGQKPQLGRLFRPEEDLQPGSPVVTVISHAFWQERFSGDPAILNQTLIINDLPATIIGVMSPEFRGIWWESVDLWLPTIAASQLLGQRYVERQTGWLMTFGRLKPGETYEHALADMERITTSLEELYPATNKDGRASVFTLQQAYFEHLVNRLRISLTAAGVLLLLCCINVSGLLLTRSTARQREMAVRIALGAGRGKIFRMLLMESMLLGLLGGLLGVLLAAFGTRWLVGFSDIPPVTFDDSYLSPQVLLLVLVISVAAGALFGLVPALKATGVGSRLQQALKAGGERSSAGGGGLLSALVVLELAVALSLLFGAALLLSSFQQLRVADPGFDADGVLTMRLDLQSGKYQQPERRTVFLRQLLAEIQGHPAVTAAGLSAPKGPPEVNLSVTVLVEDWADQATDSPETLRAYRQYVTPGYLQAMGIELLAGREFTDLDAADGLPVVMVSEDFASRAWPGGNPLGERIQLQNMEASWRTVVGVVKTVRNRELKRVVENGVELDTYMPVYQAPQAVASLLVRGEGDPAELADQLRQVVQRLDPDIPVYNVTSLREQLKRLARDDRFVGVVVAIFAAVALVVAVLGVYGVLSYVVRQRTRELGVRMALGATRGAVLALVLRQGLKLVGIGVALGLLSAYGIGKLLASQLFEVQPTDPRLLFIVVALLVAAATCALLLPARWATRVDPMLVLRYE